MARGAEVQYARTHRIRLRLQTGRRLRVSTPLLGGIPLYKAVYLRFTCPRALWVVPVPHRLPARAHFRGKVVETDSKQAKRKKQNKYISSRHPGQRWAGAGLSHPGWVLAPGRQPLLRMRSQGIYGIGWGCCPGGKAPRRAGLLSLLVDSATLGFQTTNPQPHPLGQPMSSWGWEPEEGARGCAEKRGHPAGARRRDLLLCPLACSAAAPGRRAQPSGRNPQGAGQEEAPQSSSVRFPGSS